MQINWFFLRHFDKLPEIAPLKGLFGLDAISRSKALLGLQLALNRRVDRNIELSEEGRRRAEAFSQQFSRYLSDRGIRISAVISSPYKRTKQSARIVSSRLHLGPVRKDRRLRELEPGIRFGRTFEEITEAFPAYKEAAYSDFLASRAPGGDSHAGRRDGDIAEFLAGLKESRQDSLVVTHAGVIECMHNIVCKTSDAEVIAKFSEGRSIPPGGLFVCRYDTWTDEVYALSPSYLLLS